jgi:hypothetical protein
MESWKPLPPIRWLVSPHTSTNPPRLQQMWQCEQTNQIEWRDVPTVTDSRK